ncbi:hypothetical protein D0Z00_000726 [Geotrichum galactomycetum]|uniref:Uncharacterized protein n=1 Tax=Geotrichum galactomycetum TaxID=27317 RepID=A0ACB6V8X4_9ASCO|nr:hypothetical protein D0Z00_000726 [Geotrichum candidum]
MSEEINTSHCRFYENKYPEIDDVVIVNIKEIADMGAYVKLLEYDDIEGMILLSELSRRRIRSIQKHVKVGKNEVVVVMRVDTDKGYIDLSKRRVSAEDAAKAEEKYNKSKAVHSILRHVAEKHKVPLVTLYETIGWPLSRKYGHAYDAFKIAITSPETVFEDITGPSQLILDEVKTQIGRKLTPNPTKIRADIAVSCFSYEGVEAVKAALKAGEALNSEQVPIQIKLVAAPLFVLTSLSVHKQKAIETLTEAIEIIKTNIEAAGGTLEVKMAPKAVTENDDAELAKLMEKSEAETRMVSGDEYDSGDDNEDFD